MRVGRSGRTTSKGIFHAKNVSDLRIQFGGVRRDTGLLAKRATIRGQPMMAAMARGRGRAYAHGNLE